MPYKVQTVVKLLALRCAQTDIYGAWMDIYLNSGHGMVTVQARLTDRTHYLIYILTPLLHAYWLVPYKAILEPK